MAPVRVCSDVPALMGLLCRQSEIRVVLNSDIEKVISGRNELGYFTTVTFPTRSHPYLTFIHAMRMS